MLVIFLCVNNKYLVRNHLLVYLTLCSQSRNCFGVYRQVVSYRLNLCFFFPVFNYWKVCLNETLIIVNVLRSSHMLQLRE